MKYETPQLTALMPAINAVQSTSPPSKAEPGQIDSQTGVYNDAVPSYTDWED
jgi:hypothetical protein